MKVPVRRRPAQRTGRGRIWIAPDGQEAVKMAQRNLPAGALAGKQVICLGDRDGVPGDAIAACAAGAGAQVAYTVTGCFVCAAAGAVDLEYQRVILRLALAHGPGELVVILGQADAVGVETYARTVRSGDPAITGALAGRPLDLPVLHALDPQFKRQVEPEVWAAEMGRFEDLLDCESLVEVVHALTAD